MGNVIYPHRPDLAAKRFYRCAPCGAHVGCHPPAQKNGKGGHGNGWVPLGRLANAELRDAKRRAHAAFDPIWKSKFMSRREAYQWAAGALGISADNCHIGMFDVERCDQIAKLSRSKIKELAWCRP